MVVNICLVDMARHPNSKCDWWLLCEISLNEILDSNKCDQMRKGGGILSGFIAQVPRLRKYGEIKSKFGPDVKRWLRVAKIWLKSVKILDQMWKGNLSGEFWPPKLQGQSAHQHGWITMIMMMIIIMVLILLNMNEMVMMMMTKIMVMMMMMIPRSRAKALTTTMVGGHIIHFSRPVLNINLSLYSLVFYHQPFQLFF